MKNRSLFFVTAALFAVVSTPLLAGSSEFGQALFIDKSDQNDDGEVTKREFKKSRKATFKLTDEDGSGKVNESEYVQEYANRLDKKIEDERKGHVKQTHVRFGSLDKNEDESISWDEYKASGERSFSRYDNNDDKTIDCRDKKPENSWEKSPNGVKSEADKNAKSNDDKPKWSKEKLKEMREKYARRVIHMPTTHNKKGMLAKYDSNADGVVAYTEFAEVRRAGFDNTDKDSSGGLNEDEYLVEYTNRLDTHIENMRKKQVKQAGVRFGVLDDNDNGEMTFKEYQLSGMKRFDRYDTNDDGVVSKDDPKPERSHHSHGDEKGHDKSKKSIGSSY